VFGYGKGWRKRIKRGEKERGEGEGKGEFAEGNEGREIGGREERVRREHGRKKRRTGEEKDPHVAFWTNQTLTDRQRQPLLQPTPRRGMPTVKS